MREARIVGPSAYLDDRKTAVQRAVNLYMMRVEGGGEPADMVLESAPGLQAVTDLGGPINGMHNNEGVLCIAYTWTVPNVTTLYMIDGAGTLQGIFYLDGATNLRMSMANGADQLVMVDGANLWVYRKSTNTVEKVTGDGWQGSFTVSHLDGYFIFIRPDSEQFYISSIDDATNLDALEFSSADGQPDRLVTQCVFRRSLYLFGSRSCEPWVNTGAADFPFERIQGASIDVGAVGRYAVCTTADAVVFVGQSIAGGPYVYRLQGYQPVRISDQAVEQALQKSTDLSQASIWTYQDAGGEFVCVDAPGMDTTWAWDAATGQWHERGEWVDGAWQPSRIVHAAYLADTHFVAGGTTFYRMSRNYKTLAGDVLMRERTWPHLVSANLDPVSYASLSVRCTSGEESAIGRLSLEISNDGGGVFGPPLFRSLGATGRRIQPMRWFGLGTCPAGGSRVFRLRCSDAVGLTIQGAAVNG